MAQRPLVLSMGDPAGVGPDIALAAWAARTAQDIPPFVAIGVREVFEARSRALGLNAPVESCAPGDVANVFGTAFPLFETQAAAPGIAGQADTANAAATVEAIERGVDAVFAGEAAALVTCPIAKSVLYGAGFGFPGHTEFLADLAKRHTGHEARPVMMLAGPELRTVPVTIHIPLASVPGALTGDLIAETARITISDLASRFGIDQPRIVVAGLNPHAGEGGALGTEDEAVIAPVVRQLRAAGHDVRGPLPADTLFHAAARSTYDAALCMYHDQALIPAKTLAFDEAVNVTLGLPFIRTSPDHGTAFDIAGTGKARATSLIAALRMARDMAARSGTA